MATIHTVTKGESLSRIAKQYDIASAKVLYNHEANESLRQLRPNIDQIQPGDQVNIPDKKIAEFTLAANKSYTFVVQKEAELFNLLIQDETSKEKVPGKHSLPLFTKTTNSASIELVSIYPKLHNNLDKVISDDSDHSHVPKGFIYIFVDGHLWRELETFAPADHEGIFTNEDSTFQDINLEQALSKESWQQNGFKRPATGSLQQNLLVPRKWDGKDCKVEIAFSETQWTWDYLLKLGGLHAEDFRRDLGPVAEADEINCPDPDQAQQLRDIRLEVIDLSQATASFTDHVESESGKQSKEELEHYNIEDPLVVNMTNGLFITRNMIAKIQVCQAAIKHHLLKLQGIDLETFEVKEKEKKAKYDLACFMMQTFFYKPDAIIDEEIHSLGKEDSLIGAKKDAIEFAQDMKKWRSDELDQEAFFKYLGYEELLQFAKETAVIRRDLIAFAKDTESQGSLAYCVEDFGYHQDYNFNGVGEVLDALATALKSHPAHLFAHLIRSKNDWQALSDQDEGQDFLLTCIDQHPSKPAHHIYRIIFPESTGENLHDYSTAVEERFSPKFYPAKVQSILDSETELDQTGIEQLGRRFVQLVMGISTSLFEIPSGVYSLSQLGGGSLNQATTDNKQSQAEVKSILQQAQADNAKLEKELSQTQDRFTIASTKYQDLNNQLERLPDHLKTADLDALKSEVKKEWQVLNKYQQAIEENKSKIHDAKLNLKRLQKVTSSSSTKPYSVFDGSRTHAYLNILRLLDIAEPNVLVQVDMLAADFISGNIPDGHLPLDPMARKRVMQKRIKELRQLSKPGKGNMVNANIAGLGAQQIPMEDMFKLNDRLEHTIKTLDNAQKGAEMETLDRITVYLLKQEELLKISDGDMGNASAELKAAQQDLQNLESRINNVTNTLDINNEIARELSQTEKNINALFKKTLPKDLNPEQLKSGMLKLFSVVAVFEVMNLSANTKVLFDKPSTRSMVDFVSALADTGAIFLTIKSASLEMNRGTISNTQLNTFFTEIKQFGKGSTVIDGKYPASFIKHAELMKAAARFNLAASAITASIAGYDSYQAYRRGDAGATAGWGLVTLGAAGLTIEAMPVWLATLGRGLVYAMPYGGYLAAVSFGLILLGYGIYYVFSDKPLQAWLGNSPWGKHAYQSDNSASWKSRPDFALMDLLNIISSPRITSSTTKAAYYKNKDKASTHGYNGDAYQMQFNLSIPGHIASNNNVEIEFDFKDEKRPYKGYQSLLVDTATPENLKKELNYFWQYAQNSLHSDTSGLSIQFYEGALYPLMKALDTEELEVRMRCRTAPNGNDATLPLGTEQYYLPVSDREANGQLEQKETWAEATVKVETGDYESVLVELMHKVTRNHATTEL